MEYFFKFRGLLTISELYQNIFPISRYVIRQILLLKALLQQKKRSNWRQKKRTKMCRTMTKFVYNYLWTLSTIWKQWSHLGLNLLKLLMLKSLKNLWHKQQSLVFNLKNGLKDFLNFFQPRSVKFVSHCPILIFYSIKFGYIFTKNFSHSFLFHRP